MREYPRQFVRATAMALGVFAAPLAWASDAEELAAKLVSAPSEEEQFGARLKLLELGPRAIVPLAQHLEQGDSEAGVRAASVLGKIKTCPFQAADPLARALRSEDARKRDAALQAISELQEGARRAVPILMEILSDTNSSDGSKVAAVKALTAIGPAAEPALEVLNKSFNSSSRELRDAVAVAVRSVSEGRLISSILGGEEAVRIAAAKGLGRSDSTRSERALIRALQGHLSESKLSDNILKAIFDAIERRKIKAAAPVLVDVLMVLLDEETIERGAQVLAVLDEPNSRAKIKHATKDPDGRVRWRATIVLGEFRDKDEIETIGAMIDDSATQNVAIRALGKLGKNGEGAVKLLTGRLNMPENTVAKLIEETEQSPRLELIEELCQALHEIGTPNAKFALDVFRTEVKGTSLEARFFAGLEADEVSPLVLSAAPSEVVLTVEEIDRYCRVEGPSLTVRAPEPTPEPTQKPKPAPTPDPRFGE